MCRSRHEVGGPRRCPAHARAQLGRSIALVEELEAREAVFRAAIAEAMDKTGRSYSASRDLENLERELDRIVARIEDDPEEDPEYCLVREELAEARQRYAAARTPAARAVADLKQRRQEASAALVGAGVAAGIAQEHLDSIERDTGFAPPF
jgi:hypothetical protein